MSAKSNSKLSSSTKNSANTTSHSSPQHIPRYTPLSRTWPTHSTSSDNSARASASRSTTGGQGNMTSIQRWEAESLKDSYWTGVAEYDAAYRTASETKENEQVGVGKHWSLMGDEESDRFYGS